MPGRSTAAPRFSSRPGNTGGLGLAPILALVLLTTTLASSLALAQVTPDFLTRHDFPIAAGARGIAIADLNGDGFPDIAVACESAGLVSIRFGDGAGGSTSRLDIPVGTGPWSVIAGDFNQDGKLDLITANLGAGTVSVLLGDGTGAFPSRTDFAVGTYPSSVAMADLNGDGFQDLVVGNFGSNSISILYGNGLGGISSRSDIGAGIGPHAVAIADLNADGKPDILAVNSLGSTLTVILSQPSGGYASAVQYPTSPSPYSLVVADLTGDGKLDVATADYGANTATVFPGNGDGTFGAGAHYPVGGEASWIATADVNGDGRLDLLTAGSDTNTMSLLVGQPSGGFVSKLDLATGSLPWPVAIADLNHDGRPDLVSANYNGATVSVFLQAGPRTVTTLSLTSSPNPSSIGQPISLVATINPAQATGQVTFLDGATTLGILPLTSGMATLGITPVGGGLHQFSAQYAGNDLYKPSNSVVVNHTVTPGATTTTVSASANPSFALQPITLTATVAPVQSGTGTPDGSVQFRIDHADFGYPAPLAGGVASVPVSSLTEGAHEIQAVYSGSASYNASTSPVFVETVTSSGPVIVGVRDVPNDQGGRVFLTWKCLLDQPGIKIVTGYRVWRRAPDPTLAPGTGTSPGTPSGAAPAAPTADRRVTRATAPDGRTTDVFWEAIASLPSEQRVNYAFTAPTTQDSLPDSNPYTTFSVTALTADPFTFFQSAPDSGYSVDNLSPPTPTPFVATYTATEAALHWAPNPAPDFREFRLYRGLTADFVPGATSLVVATQDTGYVDPVRTPYFYKLAAFDVHANASRYALVSPNSPVATLASVVRVDPGPDRIGITWYAGGNPGLSATLYREAPGSGWVAVTSLVVDGTGYMRYEDLAVTEGGRYGYRLGIMDAGVELFVGEVWATAERLVFALEGARPNPVRARDLTVWFSLPDAAPARLDVLDVGGRKVASREVGSLGPGRHAVGFGDGPPLPPGIYLVRLIHAGESRVIRAAVLN